MFRLDEFPFVRRQAAVYRSRLCAPFLTRVNTRKALTRDTPFQGEAFRATLRGSITIAREILFALGQLQRTISLSLSLSLFRPLPLLLSFIFSPLLIRHCFLRCPIARLSVTSKKFPSLRDKRVPRASSVPCNTIDHFSFFFSFFIIPLFRTRIPKTEFSDHGVSIPLQILTSSMLTTLS